MSRPVSRQATTRRDAGLTGADELEDTQLSEGSGTPQTLLRGAALGRYLVVNQIGAGGMGVVYRAFDPDLDRSVALKLVGVARSGGQSTSENERARLLREAQAMARLSHPNVIPVFDVGILDDAVFVAMELVDGVTLRRWLAQKSRRWDEILPIFMEAGRGLAAAHAANLIHRDFKPDNVMIGGDGRVRVLDFGLARAAGDKGLGATSPDREALDDLRSAVGDSLERSMTVDGAVLGTPAYMSPEQHLGATAGAASDQFSFCIALFEALYGARPFVGDTVATVALEVLGGKVTVPAGTRGKVPAWVHAALVRGLKVDADARFPGMEALLTALSYDPSRRHRRWALGLGAAGVLAAGTALGTLLPDEPPAAAAAVTLCTGAQERLGSVWSPSRRASIGEAFTASGLAYAADAWTLAARQLDKKAEAWVQVHTATCRATRVTGEQSAALMDLRMACLERQRLRMDALLTELGTPDPQSIGRSFDAAHGLPDAASCGDLDALHGGTPPPEEPAQRQELAALTEGLSHVYAQLELGRVTAARDQLSPLLPRAEALDHPPLTAEALALQAELEAATGEIKPARRSWERAYAAAIAARDPRLAGQISRSLAHLVGYRLVETERGEHWLRLGRASVRALGGDLRLAAHFDSAQGAMLAAAGRYDDALAAHQRALASWRQLAPESIELAGVLDDIGAVQVARGKAEPAIALHREALALKRKAYGERHPQVAASTRELGSALAHAHRWEQAKEQFERALAINRESRGERNEYVATTLDDLGRVHRRLGELDRAIELHRKALGIWEAILGDPHPDLGVSVLNVGYTLKAAGQYAAALGEFERALAMFEAAVGPQHPYVVYASNSVGATLVALGRHAQAVPVLERVLTMKDIQVDPTLLAETKFTLTTALWGADGAKGAARPRARALAQEALESYRTQATRWAGEIDKIEGWLEENGG